MMKKKFVNLLSLLLSFKCIWIDVGVSVLTRSDQATTPGQALAGEDTLELVLLLAVGTEHEADLAATSTNVTSRHVGVGANVTAELAHESDAESADLVVGLALGVEVGTTLATTHHHYLFAKRHKVSLPWFTHRLNTFHLSSPLGHDDSP